MSDELKRCPFCGGEAKAWEYEDEQDVFDPISLGWIDSRCITYHCVGCESCEIEVYRLSKADALAAWNARAAVTDEQFATAVHDGRVWQVVRECRNANTREPRADAFDVGGMFKCSECGESYRFTELPYPFCPFCGAKVVAK